MERKVKVVEFVTRLEFGGVEAMLLNYLSNFKNPEFFDFHIITQDINDLDCIKEFEKIGCKVHIVTHKRKGIFKNVKEIFHIMKTEHFDVVHSHMTMTNFYVLFMAKMLGVPTRISHSHGSVNDIGFETKITDFILKKLNKWPANILMSCGYDAGAFLYGKKAIDRGNVFIVKNAIDLKKFEYNDEIRQAMRNQYGINDGFCIGQVGRFVTVKNHEFTLRVFKEILKTKPNAKLLLVGDGELHDEIYNKVNELYLNDSVVFTGNVSNTNELYQAMDVLVLPSFHEGFPVVTVEAQAAGLPCIISDKVDRSCAMTPGIRFMSIEKEITDWASVIIRSAENVKAYSGYEALTQAGYNIAEESPKLEYLYKTGDFKQGVSVGINGGK